MEVLPAKVRYAPDGPVDVEVRDLPGPATLTVWHLGDRVALRSVETSGIVDVGPLPEGGYGVEVEAAGVVTRTALEVTAVPRGRIRYGFVASFAPDRDVAGVSDLVRRLHLDAVQLYDWAYRHADLLGGGETYQDALGQEVSLATVRRLIDALHAVGSDALGYAAVYGVGTDQWPVWGDLALLRSDGEPYALGDFLFLVDPAAPRWRAHFTNDLSRSAVALGLDGFHLDQYGYPRRAVRADGAAVDLASSFLDLIRAVRTALPDARLVFNNVNDFPTWATGDADQDAVYIEVWEPHTTLGSLARLVTRARAVGGSRPVVLAAYQHVYAVATARAADLAASLTMATIFSHGATQLLAGESGSVLVDPYYVRSHPAEYSTLVMLRRWYDFLVEHDELLMNPHAVDVTGSWVGEFNGALEVRHRVDTAEEPVAGTVWRRVVDVGKHLVVHLINLVGQSDTAWDAPRAEPGDTGPGRLTVRRVGRKVPRVRVGDPDGVGRLAEVTVEVDAEYAYAALPSVRVWQIVVVDLVATPG
jgi:dextranase